MSEKSHLFQAIDRASDAWEQGFRVIAMRLNEILPKNEQIKALPPEDGMTLTRARNRLLNALSGLRSDFPGLREEDTEFPWIVIEGMPLGFSGGVESDLRSHCDLLRKGDLLPSVPEMNRHVTVIRGKFEDLRKHLEGAADAGGDEFIKFTATEAADYVGIPSRTMNRWIRNHTVKATDVGNNRYEFSQAELEKRKEAQAGKKARLKGDRS